MPRVQLAQIDDSDRGFEDDLLHSVTVCDTVRAVWRECSTAGNGGWGKQKQNKNRKDNTGTVTCFHIFDSLIQRLLSTIEGWFYLIYYWWLATHYISKLELPTSLLIICLKFTSLSFPESSRVGIFCCPAPHYNLSPNWPVSIDWFWPLIVIEVNTGHHSILVIKTNPLLIFMQFLTIVTGKIVRRWWRKWKPCWTCWTSEIILTNFPKFLIW